MTTTSQTSTSTLPLVAGYWPVDLAHSSVSFTVRHLGVSKVRGRFNHYAVDGELTIGEITRPITLAVELGGVETFPGGPRHAGFEATTQIKRKDFDIDIALPPGVSSVALGDVIKIEIDLQLLEPETTG
jgi:polyisoprenoid-binding protein YceI